MVKESNHCLGLTGYFNVPVILISNVEIKTGDVVVLECVGSAVLTWVQITWNISESHHVVYSKAHHNPHLLWPWVVKLMKLSILIMAPWSASLDLKKPCALREFSFFFLSFLSVLQKSALFILDCTVPKIYIYESRELHDSLTMDHEYKWFQALLNLSIQL